MKSYDAIFKCRLCGETFITSTAGGRHTALGAAAYACAGKVSQPLAPALQDIHICDNGGIGIADFIGFKEMEDDA